MELDERLVRRIFSEQDFERGLAYYRSGRVEIMRLEKANGELTCRCRVRGTKRYNVRFTLMETNRGTDVDMDCDCPRFADQGECKHVAAAMLCACGDVPDPATESKPQSKAQTPLRNPTDPEAKRILEQYVTRSRPQVPKALAHLKPRLWPALYQGEYPRLYLYVGVDRMYVVKDIREFLRNVVERKTVSYGKNLTLFHGIECFDDLSRQLIEFLMDNLRQFYVTDSYRSFYYAKNAWEVLEGAAFDGLFDILLRFPCMTEGVKDGEYSIGEEDPKVKATLTPGKWDVELSAKTGKEVSFFGSRKYLYACSKGRISRCGQDFREWVYPLLSARGGLMRVSREDMPVLCGYVLPKLRELVPVDDPKNVAEEYLPDECVPRFYFDLDGDGSALTLDVRFRYGETEVMPDAFGDGRATPKRDRPAERDALEFSRLSFPEGDETGHFRLAGDDAVYDFLTAGMDAFMERGEVFVSDRLRARRIQTAPAAVGVSVSGGTLLLDMDTGEFPAEELEELYQSLLRKRRYYKLRDGRYLTLDGSGYEALAEMAHMLRLTGKELESGHAELPAYRGLYIDSVLAGREDMRVDRDAGFRAMVREFKSLSESDYAAPSGMESILRPYQKLGFQWLKTLESCGFGGILADEMGLGKTVQMIAYFLTARRSDTGLSNLVVCPASLILNWMDELARFAPGLAAKAVMGTAAERKKLLTEAGDTDVLVTSYELLRQDIGQYEQMSFYCCVLDEGQHIKNSATLVSKAVKRLRCRQRFIMTGTPMENRLSELWNLFDFLMPGYLYSHNTFVEKLEKPAVKSGDAQALSKLRQLVRPFMLRRLKNDVLRELPPLIEHVRRVALTQEERKVYLATAAQIRGTLDEGGKLQVLAALTRLRQICCDPALCYENYAGQASKLEACLELCAGMVENGHQILLFSQFTSMLDIIRPRLEEMGISSFTLQGSTPKEKRAELVRRFNAGQARVFLISLKAGGTGLNLTAADVVIHYDPWWNVAAQDQAAGRAHRIGQRSCVQVYKLIAQNTIEEKILTLQDRKSELMSAVASDGGGNILNMSRDDLLALLDE